jgi:hypothetical protein
MIVSGVPTAVTTDNADRSADADGDADDSLSSATRAGLDLTRLAAGGVSVAARFFVFVRVGAIGRRFGPPDASPDGMAECYPRDAMKHGISDSGLVGPGHWAGALAFGVMNTTNRKLQERSARRPVGPRLKIK